MSLSLAMCPLFCTGLLVCLPYWHSAHIGMAAFDRSLGILLSLANVCSLGKFMWFSFLCHLSNFCDLADMLGCLVDVLSVSLLSSVPKNAHR